MFENLRTPKVNAISDMRGLIDPTNLAQFNQYEGGYSILSVVSIPEFMFKLATSQKTVPGTNKSYAQLYGDLITSYVKILEQEFRGLEGIENITSEQGDFTNGLTTINMINKVAETSNGTFSMRYTEKAGAIISRVHELFLKGVKDPKTGYKHYHGLIKNGEIPLDKVGFESEVFSLLYMITDNTGYRLEKSYYIVAAQPTTAELSQLFNTEKGSYDFKELSVEMAGYALVGSAIDAKAKEYLAYLTGCKVTKSGTVDAIDTNPEHQTTPQYTLDSANYEGYRALTKGALRYGNNDDIADISAIKPDGKLNTKVEATDTATTNTKTT